MCNWLIQETHPKIVLVFKRWPYYMIQQYLMHAYVYENVCHTRYICGYTCAWKKVFYTGRAPALCTVSVLHSQNNLLGIIDIGAHKPLWLQAPFARLYIFHVYYFYHCSLLKSFVHELYVTWQLTLFNCHCHFPYVICILLLCPMDDLITHPYDMCMVVISYR